MIRRGYVKRKASKAARKLPTDFPELKVAYVNRLQEEVKCNAIHLQVLFDWDQIGVKLVPDSSWTMAEGGSKQIPVVGMDDKREITLLIAATAAESLLPHQ